MNGRTSHVGGGLLAAPWCWRRAAGPGNPPPKGTPDPDRRLGARRGPQADGSLTLVEGSPVTLTVDAERWGGVAACNSYGGSVSLDGDRLTFDDGIASRRWPASTTTS
jgi:hypothetical protein